MDKKKTKSGGKEYKEPTERMTKAIESLRAYEKRNFRINQIRLLCSVLALLICIGTAVFVFLSIQKITTKADQISEIVSEAGEHFNTVAEDLEKVEFEKLGKSLQEIADMSKDTVKQANDAAAGLDRIITGVENVMSSISGIKIDSLNDAIAELNKVLGNIKTFIDKLPFVSEN